MKETGISFCGESIQGILDNRKAMTRRVIKPQPFLWDTARHAPGQPNGTIKKLWGWEAHNKFFEEAHYDWPNCLLQYCPYGQVGDLLWVRETFRYAVFMLGCGGRAAGVEYKNNGIKFNKKAGKYTKQRQNKDKEGQHAKWRSGRFMPKWAARIRLEITGIRVERLQDITEEDAKAEGIEFADTALDGRLYRDYSCKKLSFTSSPIESYQSLWDSINTKRGFGWTTNPWVWVIEFKWIIPATGGKGVQEFVCRNA